MTTGLANLLGGLLVLLGQAPDQAPSRAIEVHVDTRIELLTPVFGCWRADGVALEPVEIKFSTRE